MIIEETPILSAGESFRGVDAVEGIPIILQGGSLDGSERFIIGHITPPVFIVMGTEAYLNIGRLVNGRYVYELGSVSRFPIY